LKQRFAWGQPRGRIEFMLRRRVQFFWRFGNFLFLLLMGGSIFAQQGSPPLDSPVVRFARNPDPAPALTLKDLDGKPLSLDSSRGKVTIITFWATWCPPCRAEIPDLIDLQKKYAGKLQILGLSVDDEAPANLKKFVQVMGINYPVAVAPPEVGELYGGIPALPTTFVLDTQGRIVQKHVGLKDADLYELEIRSLLGLPVQVRVETFEDTGEIFLRHADRATELPGVDMSRLKPEQKKAALRRFNAESCACPCKLTLAQCRVNDSACPVSKAMTDKVLAEISVSSEVEKSVTPPGKP
jgi:thiol-disulfide isomerase/thioredoxin